MDYQDRMRILRESPDLVLSPPSHMVNSNCFGTVSWVFNFEREVAELWRQEKKEDPFATNDALGNYAVFAPENRRPGYIGHDLFDLFLNKRLKKVSAPIANIGDIWVLSYSHLSDELCGFAPRHAAIIIEGGRLFEKTGIDFDDKLRWDRTPAQTISVLSNHCKEITTEFYRVS
jgi:hypothetical protein